MWQISLNNKIVLIVITCIVTTSINLPVFSKQSNKVSNQSTSNFVNVSQPKTEEFNNLNLKYIELNKELDNAKSVISSLKAVLNEKNYKIDEFLKDNNKLNNRISDITKTYEMDKANYLEDMENKFDELELAKCKILELTTKINQLENNQEKNNLKKISGKSNKNYSVSIEDLASYNKNETLENYRTTVLDQSKQLSKCNLEIEKTSTKIKKYDVFLDNLIIKSKKLAKEGKINEVSDLLTLLYNSGIDRPDIFIEVINIFQSIGLIEESNKAKEIMYSLYPSLKRNDNS